MSVKFEIKESSRKNSLKSPVSCQ